MPLFYLNNENLKLVVSSHGGTILSFEIETPNGFVPLLRPVEIHEQTPASQSGCFPFIPFGNRVEGNQFNFDNVHYQLNANTNGDYHYLHGDGWLNEWHGLTHSTQHLVISYQHMQGIYQYHTQQTFSLNASTLEMTLTVTNIGTKTMPFGLGWHPYFPMTAQTTVQATANGYWLKKKGWLPSEYRSQLPAELDFNQPNHLPHKWVNNGFNGWSGNAIIHWPEQHAQLTMTTYPPCPVYFIFVSDPQFDENNHFDYFCLEPMTHAANAHNMPDRKGLQNLKPNESMTLTMTLTAELI